jgi:hypothetical protein
MFPKACLPAQLVRFFFHYEMYAVGCGLRDSIYCCPYVIWVMTSTSPVEQVRELLVDDPGNSEYVDMERELKEVVLLLWLYSFGFYFSIPYKICFDIYI